MPDSRLRRTREAYRREYKFSDGPCHPWSYVTPQWLIDEAARLSPAVHDAIAKGIRADHTIMAEQCADALKYPLGAKITNA